MSKKSNYKQMKKKAKEGNQNESAKRLAQLLQFCSAPPEMVVATLHRLEIPFEQTHGDEDPNNPVYDTIHIKMVDLVAGEVRNREQGTILQRLYGKDFELPKPPNPEEYNIRGGFNKDV